MWFLTFLKGSVEGKIFQSQLRPQVILKDTARKGQVVILLILYPSFIFVHVHWYACFSTVSLSYSYTLLNFKKIRTEIMVTDKSTSRLLGHVSLLQWMVYDAAKISDR